MEFATYRAILKATLTAGGYPEAVWGELHRLPVGIALNFLYDTAYERTGDKDALSKMDKHFLVGKLMEVWNHMHLSVENLFFCHLSATKYKKNEALWAKLTYDNEMWYTTLRNLMLYK